MVVTEQDMVTDIIVHIQEMVAADFRLTREQLLTRTRKRTVSFPRMLAMYIARQFTGGSLPWLARQFGTFDHTSVLYACRWAVNNVQYREYIDTTLARLRGD